jgi:hypothetical protein
MLLLLALALGAVSLPAQTIIEELFGKGVMVMGPSRDDPKNLVGVFNREQVIKLGPMRKKEMERVKWLAGTWSAENKVPATKHNPAYTERLTYTYSVCENGSWICLVDARGKERPHITFDPFSGKWVYILAEGAFGILRSTGWEEAKIEFMGRMLMLGVDREIRQLWNKVSDTEFRFVNEEKDASGRWLLTDEWVMRRKP